jgi:hypothetical protein
VTGRESQNLRDAVLDVLASAGSEASDPHYFPVRTPCEVERLARDILAERDSPIVGLTGRARAHEPLLRVSDVRSVIGPSVPVHLVADAALLGGLNDLIGPRLRLDPGSARVWWPGAHRRCEPAEHPVVVGLEDEDYLDTLGQLAHEYHLSHPLVRAHVRVIEDERSLLEHEIVRVQDYSQRIHQRLRDVQIDCHLARTRAEAAEARAAALEQAAARACWAVPIRSRLGGAQPE